MVEQGLEEPRVGGSIPSRGTLISGYRIVAIIRPCQGRDRGSTPLTRSYAKQLPLWGGCLVFWWQRRNNLNKNYELSNKLKAAIDLPLFLLKAESSIETFLLDDIL